MGSILSFVVLQAQEQCDNFTNNFRHAVDVYRTKKRGKCYLRFLMSDSWLTMTGKSLGIIALGILHYVLLCQCGSPDSSCGHRRTRNDASQEIRASSLVAKAISSIFPFRHRATR